MRIRVLAWQAVILCATRPGREECKGSQTQHAHTPNTTHTPDHADALQIPIVAF